MHFVLSIFIISLITNPVSGFTQSKNDEDNALKAAAIEIITEAKYCTLITVDEKGQPQARMMDPFLPEEDFVIWLGTNNNSRKVREIKSNKQATVNYSLSSGEGYVTMTGNAFLVDDSSEKEKRWKKSWEAFYQDKESTYILIKFVPDKLEVVSYKHNLIGDSITWSAPHISLKNSTK